MKVTLNHLDIVSYVSDVQYTLPVGSDATDPDQYEIKVIYSFNSSDAIEFSMIEAILVGQEVSKDVAAARYNDHPDNPDDWIADYGQVEIY